MSKKSMSEETAKRRGYVLDENGYWRKKMVLEKYFDEGYLELSGSVFSAAQRKKAGEILARDYYLGNYHSLQSVKISSVHIKTTGSQGFESSLYYKERYLKAMKYVPYEFWNIIFRVCMYRAVTDRVILKLELEKTHHCLNLADKQPPCTGIIMSLGEQVKDLKVGDKVFFHPYDELALPEKNMVVVRAKSVLGVIPRS